MSNKFRLISWRAVYIERCKYGSEGGIMKPRMGTFQGAGFLPYDVTPSFEDVEVTKRLKDAGELLGILLTDHLIVVNGGYLSLAEMGHIV